MSTAYRFNVGIKMKKDLFYTLSPLNWVLRIFILSSVKRKQNQIVKCWSSSWTLIVLTFMLVINAGSLFVKIQNFESKFDGEIKFNDSLQLTYLLGFLEYIIDLSFVYKTRNSYVKYMQYYESIDTILGFPNFSRIRKKNLKYLMLLILSHVLTCSCDYFSWLVSYGWLKPTLYGMDYLFGFINALTILDAVANVIQIEHRAKLILDQVEESSTQNGEFVTIGLETTVKTKVERLRTVSDAKELRVLSLTKYYLMLLEQVNYINKAFGIRLGAFCLNILINLIYLINIVIRMITGQFVLNTTSYYLAASSSLFRATNFSCTLLALVYHCEQTYAKCCDVVRIVDFIAIGKNVSAETKSALLELRALMLSRPISFHGAKFFTLDYPLLVSLASVVVTYSIILLQSMQ